MADVPCPDKKPLVDPVGEPQKPFMVNLTSDPININVELPNTGPREWRGARGHDDLHLDTTDTKRFQRNRRPYALESAEGSRRTSKVSSTILGLPGSLPRMDRQRSIPYLSSDGRKKVMTDVDDVFATHKVVSETPQANENLIPLLLSAGNTPGNYGSIMCSHVQRMDIPIDSKSISSDVLSLGSVSKLDLSTPSLAHKSLVFFRRIFRRDNVALFMVSVFSTVLFILLDQAWILIQDLWLNKDDNGNPRATMFASPIRIFLVVGSVLVTQYIAPEAAGSGIPQLKAVLAGEVEVEAFLSGRVFLGKIIGTMLALGAGLPIGREGPFIHLAASLAAMFRKYIFGDSISKRRILCAGAAVGIAACMGSAIGGTLFSIEVTSITFIVSYYWSTFSAAIIAFIVNIALQHVLRELGIVPLFSAEFKDVDAEGFLWSDVIVMATIGLICGLLGPFVCWLVGGALLVPQRLLVDDLLTPGKMPAYWDEDIPETFQLCILSIVVFTFSIIFSTLMMPQGIFAAMFVCGASLGRFIGAFVSFLPTKNGTTDEARLACYALVGGAGMTSSVTQTFSAGLIAYGLTGLEGLLYPVLMVTLISCGIAMQLSHNIYDSSCTLRKIPLLLVPSSHHALSITATSLMERIEGNSLDNSRPITVSKIRKILKAVDPSSPIAVVYKPSNPLLLGSIPHAILQAVVDACEKVGREAISTQEEALLHLIDQCPLIVNQDANLQKIAFLFHTLRAESAFVVDFGVAVGTITRSNLIKFQNENSHYY
ncbi:hypothetical protein AAMO2058_001470500 [Amorphochlora amoebiformis]